ncbi:MAG: serine/threonine-protein kinase [Gracilimonas sp.]
MEKKDWEKLEKIIDEVLLYPKNEQQQHLEQLCKGDKHLLKEAKELLDSINNSESFLENPKENLESFFNDLNDSLEADSFDEKAFSAQTFGPYTTTAKIDQGGMGIVYKGKRSDGEFKREVAIKVLNRRLSSGNWEKRFQQEKSILASLEHPNIAKLYDAGMTDNNRPYLVMEYIKGRSLSKFIKEEKPALSQCLNIFKQICKAIDYAHRNLIVHRDIKPHNVLINEHGQVKVLDFGIAKIISEELSEEEIIQTMESNRLLSLSYAAPEQINMGKITVATDIYAMGLVLYEMLAQQKPYDLSGKTLQQAEKIILNRETKKISANSKADLKKIDAQDLDAIVSKCLRKEAQDRYSSVQELLTDIESLQSSKPVLARKNTRIYKVRKFVGRNRVRLSLAASFLILLLTFGIMYSVNINKEKNRALEALSRAKMVSDVMVSLFEEVDYTQTEDPRLATSQFLDETLAMIDYKFADVPGEKARLFLEFGNIKFHLGELKTADSLLDKASIILRDLDEGNEYTYWLADVYNRKADLAKVMGNDHKAIVYADSLQWYLNRNEEEIKQLDIVPLDWEAYMLSAMSNKADIFSDRGEYQRSDSLYREIFNRYAARDDTTSDVYWVTRHNHGWLLVDNGDYARAESIFREVVDARTKGFDQGQPYFTPVKVAGAHVSLGWAMHMQGNNEKAEEHARKSLKMYLDIFDDKSSIEKAKAMNDLGVIIQQRGKYDEAKELIEQAYFMRKELLGDTHPLTLMSEGNMGAVYFYNGNKEKALEWFIKAHESNVEIKGETHPDHLRELSNIGAVYMQLGNNEQANRYFKKAIDIGEQYFDTSNVIYSNTLSAYNSLK